jgi:hypothetical protein
MAESPKRVDDTLARTRGWCSQHIDGLFLWDELVESDREQPRFRLPAGWVAMQLRGGVDSATGELAWWAAESIERFSTYAEKTSDGQSLILLAEMKSPWSAGEFTSKDYGYDIVLFPPGAELSLSLRQVGLQGVSDLSDPFQELYGNLQRVAEQESKRVAPPASEATESVPVQASTQAPQPHASSAPILTHQAGVHRRVVPVSLPGFGSGSQSIPSQAKIQSTLFSTEPLSEQNRMLAAWEFAHGATQVETVPVMLQIGRNNKCNFKCVYCADHRVGNNLPRHELSGDTWDDLLRLVPRSRMISFHGVSEFLLDPDFFKIVEYCASHRVGLSLNTNGSVCTEKHLSALRDYPDMLDVAFSVDAATAETYKRIRGWDFHRFLTNLRRFMDVFRERTQPTSVAFSFVITKTSVHEMTPFVFLAKAFGANYARFFRLNQYDGLDWKVESKDGYLFDYQAECVTEFAAVYNREVKNALLAAQAVGIQIDVPGLLPEPLEILSEATA